VEPERGELGDHGAVTAGGLGLLLERPELAPHLAEQVLDPGEVALGGRQPAFGLLLAPPVLEDPRGLLDDEPPLLGPGVEHGIDLALRDDHVLLATHAGVGEQLLDVEQAARHAVDGVLGVAAAEQRARDGDLVELDGQHARRVVDGEAHLGAPQRRPLGGAGEDDVVHLLGPDRAGGLGAQHPADGVDHVRLAAAVGADHDGDARLHLQAGGVGERLEPLDGKGLQEHPATRRIGSNLPERGAPLGHTPTPAIRPGSRRSSR
jgi:hypothetical protein